MAESIRQLSPKVAERIEAVRQILFRAVAIVQVAGSAATCEHPVDGIFTESTLRYVAEILDHANNELDECLFESTRDS